MTADTQGTSVLQYYSKDKPAGNEEVPRTQQFLLDTDAPAAPGDVVAYAEGLHGAFASWSPVTDATSGLDHYEVFLDDASVETTTATTVHLAGLSPASSTGSTSRRSTPPALPPRRAPR